MQSSSSNVPRCVHLQQQTHKAEMEESLRSHLFLEETSPSDDFIESVVSDLKKMRCGENPASLKNIAIQCILENKAKYLVDCLDYLNPEHSNPFTKLPNGLVQELLAALSADAKKQLKDLTRRRVQFCFLLQLLNPFTLSFDFAPLVNKKGKFESDLFRHLLLNCPRIQQIKISHKIWSDHALVYRIKSSDLIRVMACKWSNLTYLNVDNTWEEGSDYLLQLICSSFPKLVGLEMRLTPRLFTMKEVQLLSKMEKLETLGLDLGWFRFADEGSDEEMKKTITIIVHAVGQIPFLKNFAISNTGDTLGKWYGYSYAGFVDTYGQLYPDKKLAIEKICLTKDLERSWPDCLSLNELQVESRYPVCTSYTNLLTGNCRVPKLHFIEIEPAVVYSILEKFGPSGLTHLTLEDNQYHATVKRTLDARKFLAVCPKIQHFEFKGAKGQEEFTEPICQVPLENFENCEYFNITRKHNIGFYGKEDTELYMRYLLGSRKFIKTLKVDSLLKYEVVSRVLELKVPSCLDQVETISFLSFDYCLYDENNLVNKIIMPLLVRSPYLKTVETHETKYQHIKYYSRDWLISIYKSIGITLVNQDGEIWEDDCEYYYQAKCNMASESDSESDF